MTKKKIALKPAKKRRLPKVRSVRFEDWPEELRKLLEANEEAQRITEADLKIIINT